MTIHTNISLTIFLTFLIFAFNSCAVEEKIRSNPDGLDLYWIFNSGDNYIWLCCMYNNSNNPQMDYTKNIGVFLNKKIDVFYIDKTKPQEALNDIHEFRYFFDIYDNNYHPNEISAELIANYYMYLMDIRSISLTTPAIQKLNLWISA